MNARETLRLLSKQMPEIRQRFGVRELAIFGSVARNEAGPDSDVDILVTFSSFPGSASRLILRSGRIWGTSAGRALERRVA